MPTSLDARFVPLAQSLLAKYGKDVVFRTFGTKDYDPETGDVSSPGKTDRTRKIVPPVSYRIQDVDGDRIQASDLLTYVAAADIDFDLKIKTVLVIDNQEWVVEGISKLYSGEQIALLELQLRK